MKGKRLTPSQRYQIQDRLRSGQTQAQIARAPGVSPSTISEELKRNGGRENYNPDAAQARADRLARSKAKPRIPEKLWSLVVAKLREGRWSPELISRWLKEQGHGDISHTWIYERIRRDRAAGGDLHKFLPQQKRWRKKPNRENLQGRVPHRVGIEERSPEVELWEQPGHYEVDTVVGARQQGVFVTIIERISRCGFIVPVASRTVKAVCDAIIEAMSPYAPLIITSDNGREYNDRERVATALGAQWFHCDPYAPWQRGTNENFNRNARLFCAKGTNLRDYAPERVREVQYLLNERPKKCLGMRTLREVFFETCALALRSEGSCLLRALTRSRTC